MTSTPATPKPATPTPAPMPPSSTSPARARAVMVLAAGLGTRMRPLTLTTPKPLVSVAGRTLLDRALDAAAEAGLAQAVVNIHHLGAQIRTHLEARPGAPDTVVSDETDALLDSGGGVVRALPALRAAGGEAPFVLLNADTFWLDRAGSNLARLLDAFDPARMDMMMLLARPEDAVGFEGAGDFVRDGTGRLTRRSREGGGDALVYAGALVTTPRAFEGAPDGAFSLNLLFDRAIAKGRLHGLVLEGTWLHVGTPDAIPLAEAALAAARANGSAC